MDEDQLARRIVAAVDGLPVPPARRSWDPRASSRRSVLPFRAVALAVASIAFVLVIAPVIVSSVRPASSETKVVVFADDFASGIDTKHWTPMGPSTGYSVLAVNGAVELTLEASATVGTGGYMAANLGSLRCVARGDYEVSIDYTLLDWPSANGTQFVLGEFPPGQVNVRRDQFQTERYAASDSSGHAAIAATEDRAGSLRLVRHGTSVVGSYRAGADRPWVELPAQLTSPFDATFQIFLWSDGKNFAGKKVRVAVDNFRLAATNVVCL